MGHLVIGHTVWANERRIIALRRPLIGDVLLSAEAQQPELAFVESDHPVRRYEYAVLVTDLPYDVGALAQLYRDRADAENVFEPELGISRISGMLAPKRSGVSAACSAPGNKQ
ncbi:MAG TPA: hypothetical protein VF427_04495 [Noviherbaspirillum sp.]